MPTRPTDGGDVSVQSYVTPPPNVGHTLCIKIKDVVQTIQLDVQPEPETQPQPEPPDHGSGIFILS